MSTSALPAGAFFTSINGKKCTAIPRSTTSSAAAKVTTTSRALTTSQAASSVAVVSTAAPAVIISSSSLLISSSSSSTTSSSPAPIVIATSTSIPVILTTPQTSAAVPVQSSVAVVAPPPAVVPISSAMLSSSSAAVAVTSAALPTSTSPPFSASASSAPSNTLPPTTSDTVQVPLPLPSSSITTAPASAPAQESILASVVAQSASSVADSSVFTASTANVVLPTSQPATALPDVISSVASAPQAASSTVSNQIFTTIGIAPASSSKTTVAAAAGTGSTSSSANGAASAVAGSNSNSVQSTVAVAGGVIGGVIAISMVAFIIWWWRRRMLKRRRSTLLTPLTTDPSFTKDEKGPYMIKRGSIGPTPRTEKFKAAVVYNVRKIRGNVDSLFGGSSAKSPSVNMNRGNSQFMEPVSTHSRGNSSAMRSEPTITTKDRFVDWWSRLTADMNFNWRIKNDSVPTTDAFGRNMKQKAANGSQPDFLTFRGMEDRELDREALRRRASASRNSLNSLGRRSRNASNASAGSTDHFLGGLSLNFDDPFSDANSSTHSSAKPAPLVVSQPNNPFSDANAIRPNPFSDANAIRDPPPIVPKPTTYVSDIRRSRGQSISDALSRAPSTVYNRESASSVESFSTRRNKFRSDPFDLERPELLGRSVDNSSSSLSSGPGPIPIMLQTDSIREPKSAHTRTDSFTSRYLSGSSGMSLGDWSDPGPDIGPSGSAAKPWDGPEARESPTQGWRDRQDKESAQKVPGRTKSGSSQTSAGVGKAL